MINLITAIGNTYIYEKIKNFENYNVVVRDIQYQEGILEILNINKNIDLLLIGTKILEEKYFIEKIREKNKNIEIIIFTEQNDDSNIAYFNSNGIYKIYYDNKKGYDAYLKSIHCAQENITEQVRNDTKDFKKEILKKQNKKRKKENFLINKKEKNFNRKVIMISGPRGVRKKYFFKYIF